MGEWIVSESGAAVGNYSSQRMRGVDSLGPDGNSCLLLAPLHASGNCLMRARLVGNLLAAGILSSADIAPLDVDMGYEESVAPMTIRGPYDMSQEWVALDCFFYGD